MSKLDQIRQYSSSQDPLEKFGRIFDNIKGDKGDTGEKGDTGFTGRDGPAGKDGRDAQYGVDGKNGKNGLNGVDGVDGKNGKDGKHGKDGVSPDVKDVVSLTALELQKEPPAKQKDLQALIEFLKRGGFRGGGGSGGSASPLTTKGDIFTFGTANTRLPVGTNGQVLSSDSTQSTGLKWVASAIGTWHVGEQITLAGNKMTFTLTFAPSSVINLTVSRQPQINGLDYTGTINGVNKTFVFTSPVDSSLLTSIYADYA